MHKDSNIHLARKRDCDIQYVTRGHNTICLHAH